MKGLAHARLGRVGPYRSQKGWVGKAWTCLCRPAGLFTDLVLSEVPLTCFPVGCYSAFFVDGRFCLIQWFFTCFSGFRLQSLTGSGPVFLRVETFLSGIILCLGLVIRLILTGISLVIASLPYFAGGFFFFWSDFGVFSSVVPEFADRNTCLLPTSQLDCFLDAPPCI